MKLSPQNTLLDSIRAVDIVVGLPFQRLSKPSSWRRAFFSRAHLPILGPAGKYDSRILCLDLTVATSPSNVTFYNPFIDLLWDYSLVYNLDSMLSDVYSKPFENIDIRYSSEVSRCMVVLNRSCTRSARLSKYASAIMCCASWQLKVILAFEVPAYSCRMIWHHLNHGPPQSKT